jgi:hypothetical protein
MSAHDKIISSTRFSSSKFRMGDSDMSDLNLSDDEGFSGHEKILLEKHRSKLGKKSGIREVCMICLSSHFPSLNLHSIIC